MEKRIINTFPHPCACFGICPPLSKLSKPSYESGYIPTYYEKIKADTWSLRYEPIYISTYREQRKGDTWSLRYKPSNISTYWEQRKGDTWSLRYKPSYISTYWEERKADTWSLQLVVKRVRHITRLMPKSLISRCTLLSLSHVGEMFECLVTNEGANLMNVFFSLKFVSNPITKICVWFFGWVK